MLLSDSQTDADLSGGKNVYNIYVNYSDNGLYNFIKID